MRLGGPARYFVEVNDKNDVAAAIAWAKSKNLPVIMIGSGSNIVWSDQGFSGLVMADKIMRFEKYEEDSENVYITVGGGENWDTVVERCVKEGLTGIEALSLIPGTAGATPVQNVGAYGQEISQTLVSVEAYSADKGEFQTIRNIDCGFGYRTSRFKTTDRGKYFITAITLHLRRGNPQPPFYNVLQSYFTEHNIITYSPQIVRDAVISIRTSKLPDPAKVANNGSFFANPIVDEDQFTRLRDSYPDIRYWEMPDGKYKIAAAWLVEKAGFKDVHDQETGMATWPKQALVLVNEHAKSSADVLKFKQKIVTKVSEMFGITLEQEPEYIGD